jgi:hypothetical protein
MTESRISVNPALVGIKAIFPTSSAQVSLPNGETGSDPRTVRVGFGPRGVPVVKMDGKIEVKLESNGDRQKCGLEFMQFVTPMRFERTYAGRFEGHGKTVIDWASHIRGREFLDGATNDNGSDLVPVRKPFMSQQPHNATATTGGVFINSMADHPSLGMPEWILGQNGQKHFLLSASALTTFTTFLVFVHPNANRQLVAMISWFADWRFSTRWVAGIPRLTGSAGSIKSTSAVIADPSILGEFDSIVRDPQGPLLNQVANPDLMTSAKMPAKDGKVFHESRDILGGEFFFEL